MKTADVLAVVALAGCGGPAYHPAALTAAPVAATQSVRHDHQDMRRAMLEIDERLRTIAWGSAAEAGPLMSLVTETFDRIQRTHADWEDRVLYPIADATIGGPVTATMRHEHVMIVHEIAALTLEKDPQAYARRGFMLLGLLRGHLDVEEAVVLPAIDRAMSVGDFERAVDERGGHKR